jgi:hypothetical protein
MKLIYYKVIFFCVFTSFLYSNRLVSQESQENKQTYDVPMKKGSWAIVFELGTLLWGSFGNYNSLELENYNFLIKYHLNNRTAMRLNFALNGITRKDLDYSINYDNEYKMLNLEFDANLQYFITDKYFAKPFISVGPYYSLNHYNNKYKDSYSSTENNWSLGLLFTMGAEVFIYKNVGLIGEYIIKGSFNKYNYSYRDSHDILYEQEKNVWRVKANTSRFGVSFYF